MTKDNHYIVILAGGGGTRLWPKSRQRKPKQFLKIVSNRTLLQETYKRIESLISPDKVYVITSENYTNEIRNQLPQVPEKNILIEPKPRGTAAAIGLATSHIAKRDPKAIISTLASDHLIKKGGEFRRVLSASSKAAAKGDYLVTIGIHPTYPHTGLGYIHINGEVFQTDSVPVFKVEDFTEKPSVTKAQAFLATGEYFWNANLNTYSAISLMSSIDSFMPELYETLKYAEGFLGSDKYQGVLEEKWEGLDNVPIDTGILEKAKNVLMLPGDFGWADLGDWLEVAEVVPKSEDDNTVLGEETTIHLGVNSRNCFIHGSGRLIATVGLKDMIIIDTVDAILVCPKSKAQEVKKLVERLRREKRYEFL